MKLSHRIMLLPVVAILVLWAGCAALFALYPVPDGSPAHVLTRLSRLQVWIAAFAGIVLLVSILLARAIAQTVTRPLFTLLALAREIADGNISLAARSLSANKTAQTRNSDADATQFWQAIVTMTTNLDALVGQVQRSGVQVTISSSELLATAQWQETTVKKQMDSMQIVRHSVEEVAEIITDLATTMHQVASMSQEAADFATSGQTGLQRMGAAMERMESASQIISHKLAAINQKMEAIAAIVITITKVSEHTNLLSLNASIEAEKAGEYGRGFSVIAREIRRLADQTAVATLDIERMVRQMESAVTEGVMAMDQFVAEIRNGVTDVGEISEQFSNIIAQVQALSPSFDQINVAMEHQSRNTQGITTEMTQLSDDMGHTMFALQESYRALEQLKNAAHTLQAEVSRFQVHAAILNDIEIFQAFEADVRTHLQQRMQQHPFTRGTAIVRQGDRTDSLYIVAKGVLSVQVQLPDGATLEVGRKGVGEVFGEISLLTGEPRTASVLGLTDGEVFELKKTDIAPFIAADPEIAQRFSAMLTEHKMDTEAKKHQYAVQHLDRQTLHAQTLQKIQQFFGLTSHD